MSEENLNLSKDDKWLLASHMQKSIRRGLCDEAAWAAGYLHRLDRSYLAYRLSVISVEDTAAGDISTTASLIGETPWGAKRFGTTRDEVERQAWEQAARTLAGQTKDRTPCDWMACRYWLAEFEQQEGKWEKLDPFSCIEEALKESLPWWKRGLFAWRAVGTERFPADDLPVVPGEWEEWIAAFDDIDLQRVMEGLGGRQREPHPIFLPLAVMARKSDPQAREVEYVLDSPKNGIWLSAAIDGHTKPGLGAIHHFVRQLTPEALAELSRMKATPAEMTKRLMFWMDGGHINRGWEYQTQKTIALDTRKKWLASIGGGNGQLIARYLGNKQGWYSARQTMIDRLSKNTIPSGKI